MSSFQNRLRLRYNTRSQNDKKPGGGTTLTERERELAEVQRIAKVGGVIVEFKDGFQNIRSPEYLKIHGLPAEAINETHDDWVRRIHPDDRDRAVAQFTNALSATSDHYSSEYRIVRPSDGEIRWIAAEARIERDVTGRAVRMVGAHIDITDRATAREMLRESEQRFKLIADSAPVPIWVTQLDRTRSFANRAYCDFVGLPYDEAIKFDWRAILHPDDVARVVKESIEGEASLEPFVLEGRYRRSDGDWRWIRSESQPRWDPAGKHIGFIGVAHDISAAKTAEIELRNMNDRLEHLIAARTSELISRESQLRAILETTNQYQALLDLEGRLLYVNAVALAAIRSNTSDVLGKLLWQSPWFSTSAATADVIRKAFEEARTGVIVKTDVELVLPGGPRNIDFALRPVFNERQSVAGILAEGLDTTERRRNEEALRQAQKMEAVGQLTGGVAHDFNNLLTIIRSATDFLRRRDLSEERRRRYVDAISDTAERASKLTGQLLAFARRQPLSPVNFDVTAQVRNIVDLMRPLVGNRIQIEVDAGSEPQYAIADVAQFETAVVNLAVNARDAMNGEGRLKISVGSVDEVPAWASHPARPGSFIAVSVSDTGVGIAPDILELIFEPFFTTKEIGKGTGLGLSQAFGFVKQSGGDIIVNSRPGSGATFTIYLPRSPAPEDEVHENSVPTAGGSGVGRRILVVEDNLEVGSFSTELLRDLGYTIEWATSADEALGRLAAEGQSYDLVFSDVIMPGMNGIEFATIVRSKYPGLPVVLTSGYSGVLTEEAHQGFELVRKPYSVEVLSQVLRRAINRA